MKPAPPVTKCRIDISLGIPCCQSARSGNEETCRCREPTPKCRLARGTYVVTAQDTSYNESPNSPELVVTAAKREVTVTFTVTVPTDTPSGDTVFIAGDFQGWNPGSTPMTKVDATHWTISLPFEDGQHPQYKYVRGTWDAVEKDGGCGEIPNRTIQISYGDQGAQSVADVVAKWRDINHCG